MLFNQGQLVKDLVTRLPNIPRSWKAESAKRGRNVILSLSGISVLQVEDNQGIANSGQETPLIGYRSEVPT